jgi:hypothetical protein
MLADAPTDRTAYVLADLHDPAAVLAEAGRTLDLDQPVAVMFMGVLGHVADIGAARAAVRGLLDRLPSGSFLVHNDGSTEGQDEATTQAQDDYADTGATAYRNRPVAELESLYAGLDLVEPGFVPIIRWRPDGPVDEAAGELYGAVGRKP